MALLGVFELTIMADCYDYKAKILLSLHPCVLETFDQIFGEYGSNEEMFNFLALF